MGPTIEALTRDFSWSVIEALRSYDAERTGVPCPAFLLKNATQARQAFHGSVLRRRDGTYHVVDFTGGVKTSGEAICLMLKPLAGGPAKQFYPAELAQSVEWVHMACLSNKSFADTSDTPPLKQGGRAVAGVKLAGSQIDCRIVWDVAGVVLLVLVSLLLVTKEDGAGGHGAQRRVPRAVDRNKLYCVHSC